MNQLDDIYRLFPNRDSCLTLIENLRWGDKPICPRCRSENPTAMAGERRYHCNSCFTSFSATVNTIFHKTKIDLQKWFYAIFIFLNSSEKISARRLSELLEVNKNTAWRLSNIIKKALISDRDLLKEIVAKINMQRGKYE
jgi:transposase-like protein